MTGQEVEGASTLALGMGLINIWGSSTGDLLDTVKVSSSGTTPSCLVVWCAINCIVLCIACVPSRALSIAPTRVTRCLGGVRILRQSFGSRSDLAALLMGRVLLCFVSLYVSALVICRAGLGS